MSLVFVTYLMCYYENG